MGNDIYIIGIGMIKFGKWLERDVKDLTREALENVLEDCELTREDIQACLAYASEVLHLQKIFPVGA